MKIAKGGVTVMGIEFGVGDIVAIRTDLRSYDRALVSTLMGGPTLVVPDGKWYRDLDPSKIRLREIDLVQTAADAVRDQSRSKFSMNEIVISAKRWGWRGDAFVGRIVGAFDGNLFVENTEGIQDWNPVDDWRSIDDFPYLRDQIRAFKAGRERT